MSWPVAGGLTAWGESPGMLHERGGVESRHADMGKRLAQPGVPTTCNPLGPFLAGQRGAETVNKKHSGISAPPALTTQSHHTLSGP